MGSRSRVLSGVGRLLPPTVSLPLRARFGRSRERELALLPELVRPGDHVIDVGAHKGVYAYHLARLVGSHGSVTAYEPQAAMTSYLRAAGGRGVMTRVELRAVALSDRAGTATLSVPLEEGLDRRGEATLRTVDDAAATQSVPTARLDDESLPGRISFVKIDVEGHELALLQGARGLLERDRPALLIEIEHRHAPDQVPATAALLVDELGYTATELGPDGTRLPVPRARWDSGEALNRRPDGPYVNNFCFVAGPAGASGA